MPGSRATATPSSPPVHDRCAILATGDELLIGQLLDTNSQYLAEQLTARGIMPVEHATVGDELAKLVATIRQLAEEVPLIVMSGGLGPTDGDLTRAALAQVLGEPLVEDEEARAALEARLKAHGRPVTALQLRQAQRPASATCLPNARGTAPGLQATIRVSTRHGSADIFCLPGPPGELRLMFEQHVLPCLRPDPSRVIVTLLLHVIGLAESEAAERLKSLTARTSSPLVGITASGAVLTVRIRYEGAGPREGAERAVADAERAIRAALGDHVFGSGDQTLASVVLDRLRSEKKTIATVESCTGGLLGAMLSEIPGSSATFVGGWVTYSNALKTSQVGVPTELLNQHGAVSDEVARAMALGGLERCGADMCLSITGIAGPDGGTPSKPVGTVHIALVTRSAARVSTQAGEGEVTCEARRFLFPGDREDVRTRAARSALAMAYFTLAGGREALPTPRRLLWQKDA